MRGEETGEETGQNRAIKSWGRVMPWLFIAQAGEGPESEEPVAT
ncbi:MAG: hypothetical protein ACPL5F_03455 [Moorellaceae bacterium]